MSAPNPSHRECYKCGEPTLDPWPAPELCKKHVLENLDALAATYSAMLASEPCEEEATTC
jgi:hypothetical protein